MSLVNLASLGSLNFTKGVTGNGLSISSPSAVLFADGDQPFSLDGVNAVSFSDAQNPIVTVVADYYVNSIDGDNGNDGASAAQAFADIATMETAATGSGVSVGLARGSSWSEIISDTALDAVNGYGQGPLPILDATTTAPTWTQPDAATYPNVWSASIDHQMVSTQTRIIVLEDGIMLPRQTSIANVNSNAGSRYSPSDGSLPSNDPATVYIHATGSGNPNTNGKTYLIVIRDSGISVGDDATVKDVELRGGGHSDGALRCGRNADIQRVLMRDCGKHHMFMEGGGSVEDCVAVAADFPLGTDGGQSLYIAYDDAANGQSATFKRAFAINGSSITQPANPISRNAHYAHSQPGQLWTEIVYEQSASIDLLAAGDFSAGDATQFRARGCFARGTDKAFNVGGTSYCRNAEFLYNQCQNAQTGMFDLKPNGACAVTIRHNVLAPWNWGLSRWMIDGNSNLSGSIEYNTFVAPAHYKFIRLTGGTVTHRYNLYVMNDGSPQNIVTLPSGVTSDYNVYINRGAGQLKYTYNGTEYANLAAYQAATGQEANSLEFIGATLADVFSGTPTDGDFRINASGTIGAQVAALGAGAQYHWNWNSGAVAAGPSEQWPVVPTTLALARQYVNHPARWDFYDDNDPAFDSYTLTMTIEASGTIDFDNTAYAAVTENSGADASGAIDVTGTLAQINALFADPEPGLDNWSSETLNMSMTITHDASGRTASKTISVGSVAALTSTAINDSTAIGAVLDTVTSLPGATYSIINADQIYRPVISNIVAAETSDTTATIDLDIWMRETTAGTLWWYVGTSATRPSVTDLKAGTGATASNSQAISNSGTSVAEAQSQISVTGLSASTAYYVHVYCEDANGAETDIASRQPDPVSFTTEVPANAVISGTTGSPSFSQSGGYDIYTFTGNGSFTLSSGGDVEYLVIAGGGGGGTAGTEGGGGGGAGGLLSGTIAASAATYDVVVGAAGVGAKSSNSYTPTNGGNSDIQISAFSQISGPAVGGGLGATNRGSPAAGNGGSGGGGMRLSTAGGTGTAGQGYAGGTGSTNAGGGGGGSGAAGTNAGGGNGGGGTASSITGSSVTYAGGGGGGGYDISAAGTGGSGGGGDGGFVAAGSNATGYGSGGGGGSRYSFGGGDGGDGSAGVVIIRVPTP